MTLASDPYSDELMLVVQDGNNDLTFRNWTGSSWGSSTVLENNTGLTGDQPFVFIYDNNPLLSRAPVITLSGITATYVENAPPTLIDPAANVIEPDGNSFNTGVLTVQFNGGGSPSDLLGIRNQGAGPGQIGISGANVTFGGVIIGTFSGGTGLSPLTVTFNSNAFATQVQAVVRNLTFSNSSDDPGAAIRSIGIDLTDGDGDIANGVTALVQVTAVNDAPAWTVPGAQITVEDTALVFSATNGNLISVGDVDAGSNQIEVTITATNGTFSLNGTTGLTFLLGDGTNDATMQFTGTVSSINAALDGMSFLPTTNFNGGAALDLLVDDLGNSGSGGALSDAASIGITVTASNDAPVITANNLTLSEGQTVTLSIANLNSSDIDNTPAQLTYTVSNVTNGFFALASSPTVPITSFTQAQVNSGTIVFVHDGGETAPSYDVTVSDGSLSDGPNSASITFTNVNDAPSIGDQSFSVLENTASGSTVATIFASDPDTGDALTFSITGSSVPGAFAIDPTTGQIVVADSSLLDHETVQTITLTVTVQDLNGATDSATVTAIVMNVNEFGVTTVSDADANPDAVAENVIGTTVGITAFAIDGDLPDTVTYSLDNDGGGRFAIDPATGVITVIGALDFETMPGIWITARAASSDGSFATRSFLVRILDQGDVLLGPPFEFVPVLPPRSTDSLKGEQRTSGETLYDNPSLGTDIGPGGIDGPEPVRNVSSAKGGPRRPEDAAQGKSNGMLAAAKPPDPSPSTTVPSFPTTPTTQFETTGPVEDLRVQFESTERASESVADVRTTGIVLGTGSITLVGVGSILLQTRLGAMLMSLMSSVPMWRQFDPLSVLNQWDREKRKKKRALEREDQSLAPILGN